jgi:hypothetical protein
MDNVYDDFEYALANIRLNDGAQNINRYVAAALVSRWALYEGSWQKYYYNNPSQATKFFNLAVAAGDIVMNSGRFDITLDFRSLFGSKDLSSSKDVILYRKYDAAQGVTHCVASYSNVSESRSVGPNLSLIKSFVCVDGKDWQTSSVENSKDFSLANLIKTRDSRFEASFYHKPTVKSKSCYLYPARFKPDASVLQDAGISLNSNDMKVIGQGFVQKIFTEGDPKKVSMLLTMATSKGTPNSIREPVTEMLKEYYQDLDHRLNEIAMTGKISSKD